MFNKNKNPKDDSIDGIELQNLRTYEDDLKNVIQTDNISTTKIVLAEQEKKETLVSKEQIKITSDQFSQPKQFVQKGQLIFVLSLILLLSGAYIIYYNFNHIKPYFKNLAERNTGGSDQVLVSNKKIIIESLGKTKGEIIDEIQNISSNEQLGKRDEIVEIIINKSVDTFENNASVRKSVQINAKDIFNLIDSRADESLIRSLKEEATIGVHILDRPEPFIIFKSDSINQTYSGLLDWEKNMGLDLQKIFSASLTPAKPIVAAPIIIEENGTTTEVSQAPNVVIPTFNLQNFIDIIISNKDTRAIVDSLGKIRFFYSIVDNEYIIMTTNKNTLDLLLNRINQVKLIR